MNHDELKSFRIMVGKSQNDLADLLGYGRRAYQKMERGQAEIRPCVGLACAAIALGMVEYNGPMVETFRYKRQQKKNV